MERSEAVHLVYRATTDAPPAVAFWQAKEGRSLELRIDVRIDGSRSTTSAASHDTTIEVDWGGDTVTVVHGSKRARVPSAGERPSQQWRLQLHETNEVIDSPAGKARVREGVLLAGRDDIGVRIAVAAPPHGLKSDRITAALFPRALFGGSLSDALATVDGLPVLVEFATGASLELIAMHSGTAQAEEPPAAAPPREARASRKSRGVPILNPLTAEQLEDLNDALRLLLGDPIDAGVAFGERFYAKLASGGSAFARLVLPKTNKKLRFDLDWFKKYRARLIDVDFAQADDLDGRLANAVQMVIAARLALAEEPGDVKGLVPLLTSDEVDELETLMDEAQDTERWYRFSTEERRAAIALGYLTSELAAPQPVDLRPPRNFSSSFDDSPLEGVSATYDAGSDEATIRNILGVMHLHLHKLRFTLRANDPACDSPRISASGPKIVIGLRFFEVTFDFWTEPSADPVMIAVRIATIGLTDAALWNAGFGGASIPDSTVSGFLAAERHDATLKTRWRNGEADDVDINLFAIGWNLLQDLVVLAGDVLVSLFDLFRTELVAAIEKPVNKAIDEHHLLEFPSFFQCGEAGDATTKFLAAPSSVEPLLTARESLYYRGIYAFGGPNAQDRHPFDPVLPADGAYVIHRTVLARLVERRTGLQRRRPSLRAGRPDTGTDADLLPPAVRNARRLEGTLFDAIAAAGYLDPADAERWKHIVQLSSGFLPLLGFEGPLLPIDVVPVPALTLGFEADVAIGNGLNGVAIVDGVPDPMAVVRARIPVSHTISIRILTPEGRDVRDILRSVWSRLSDALGESSALPPSFGEVPIGDFESNRQFLLTIGLASQGFDEPLAGIPPAFDFSLDRMSLLADGPTTWLGPAAYQQASRETAVRTRVADLLDSELPNMHRKLGLKAGQIDFTSSVPSLPAGVAWHVTKKLHRSTDPTLAVRTLGDRIYLDFDLELFFLSDLHYRDLRP